MIQRIQSLYLILTTLLPLLFLKGSFLRFVNNTGSDFMIKFRGLYQISGEKTSELITNLITLQLIIILIPLFSLITILLFRKRKIQLITSSVVILLSIILIITGILNSISVIRDYQADLVPDFRMIVPLLILLFAVMAYRGIRKDEKLIESYDRLR